MSNGNEEQAAMYLPEQVCFPMYASSRMVTRMYKPLLDRFDLTYPQYLVMLVLWQHQKLSISELGNQLFLNTNTLTPLLKKMKQKDLIKKQRSKEDERTVYIILTDRGLQLKEDAKSIPGELLKSLDMSAEEIATIRKIMWKFLGKFNVKTVAEDDGPEL